MKLTEATLRYKCPLVVTGGDPGAALLMIESIRHHLTTAATLQHNTSPVITATGRGARLNISPRYT